MAKLIFTLTLYDRDEEDSWDVSNEETLTETASWSDIPRVGEGVALRTLQGRVEHVRFVHAENEPSPQVHIKLTSRPRDETDAAYRVTSTEVANAAAPDIRLAALEPPVGESREETLRMALMRISQSRGSVRSAIGPLFNAGAASGIEWMADIADAALKAVDAWPEAILSP